MQRRKPHQKVHDNGAIETVFPIADAGNTHAGKKKGKTVRVVDPDPEPVEERSTATPPRSNVVTMEHGYTPISQRRSHQPPPSPFQANVSPVMVSIPLVATDDDPFAAPATLQTTAPPIFRMHTSKATDDVILEEAIETPIRRELADLHTPGTSKTLNTPGTSKTKTPRKSHHKTPHKTPHTENQMTGTSGKNKQRSQGGKTAMDVWHFFKVDSSQQRVCTLCEEQRAIHPGIEVAVYLDTSSTGVMRYHLYTQHFEDWIAKCDSHGFDISSKDPKLRRLIDGYRRDHTHTLQAQSMGIKYIQYSPEAFVNAVTDWIIADDQSLNVIKNPYLRAIFLMLRKGLQDSDIPHRTTIRNQVMMMLEDHYTKIREVAKNTLGKSSFTTDMWTDPNGVPYMALTMHWISTQLKILPTGPQYVLKYEANLIGFTRVPGRHTGEHLSIAFMQTLDHYSIIKFGWLTMDNAFNNDTLARNLKSSLNSRRISFCDIENRIRCFPHIVNLACQAVLSAITDLRLAKENADNFVLDSRNRHSDPIAQLRTIIRLIRSSPLRRAAFIKELERYNIKPLELLRDIETRWSSTYLMIQRALFLRKGIDSYVGKTSVLRSYLISPDAWSMLEDYLKILRVPHGFQQLLSAEKTPTLSHAIPTFRNMISLWKKYQQEMPLYYPVIEKGIIKLEEYKEYTSEVPAYTLAILLNPSKKLKWFEINSPQEVDRARTLFIQHLEPYYCRNHTQAPAPTVTPAVVPHSLFGEELADPRWAEQLLGDDMGVQSGSSNRSLETEVDAYFLDTQPCIDMVAYWQENQLRFPTAFLLALDVLPIQGSAVPCERVFSSAKETKTARRNRVKPDLMEALQILKFSKKGGLNLSFTAGTDEVSELRAMEDYAEDTVICPEDPDAFIDTLQSNLSES